MDEEESDPLLTDRPRFRSTLGLAASFGSSGSASDNRLELDQPVAYAGTSPNEDSPISDAVSAPPPMATTDRDPSVNDTADCVGLIQTSRGLTADESDGDNGILQRVGIRAASDPHDTGGGDTGTSASDIDGNVEADVTSVLQACVFIEDAIEYRSIHHRVDKSSLKLYRFYYSLLMQWLLYVVIVTLHMLAFLEYPSSLTATSDLPSQGPRIVLHCGITESIEIVCLLVLLFDLVVKSYLKGKSQFVKSRWLWMSSVILAISLVDWCVSVGFLCTEMVRVRRMLRPFFLLQNSTLMKKTVNCLRKTVPHVVSVLLLLFMHLYFFTLFGMLLFPKDTPIPKNSTRNGSHPAEEAAYFHNPVKAFMSLLVLLTTANNPDVTMPAYKANRLYAIFFILYLAIGLFCLMNMLTAVIYNQFRGYFSNSIQASLFRRRLGVLAAFEVLRKRRVALKYNSSFTSTSPGVPFHYVQKTLEELKIRKDQMVAMQRKLDNLPGRLLNYTEFQAVFSILDLDLCKTPRPHCREEVRPFLRVLQKICTHRYFNYFGCFVALANVICITLELALEYEHVRNSHNSFLGIFNLVFVAYFCVEQCLKVWGLGWPRYAWDRGNIFDGIVTLLLVIVQGVYVTVYGIPFWGKDHVSNRGVTLWDLVRIINMLIMIRLLRMIVSQITSMSIVASTLIDLGRNLRAFVGILVVLYYSYALLGMEFFRGVIKYESNSSDTDKLPCGSYEQLDYWANNFDDFAASLVVLWDVMVVNNWHVFLVAYSKYSSPWAQIYFIVWWLLSVVMSLNLFTALILENFIMRWDRVNKTPGLDESYRADYITVLDLFRPTLQEPSHEALEVELRQHPYFDDVS